MQTKVDVKVDSRPDETICKVTCNGQTVLVTFREDEIRVSCPSARPIPIVPGLKYLTTAAVSPGSSPHALGITVSENDR